MAFRSTRRQFNFSLGAGALAASGALSLPAWAKAGHTFKIGATEVIILSDGTLSLPTALLLPGLDDAARAKLLTPLGLALDNFRPDCNITLVRKDDRVILFDAGSGPNFQATAGALAENLEDAGIDPQTITDVVLTHAHPDHIWGIIDDFDELVFSEAQYWISAAEWDFWRAGDTLEKIGEARTSFVIGARNRFEYIEDRLHRFQPGTEIMPGIEAVDTSGHTPGHCSFSLRDGGEEALVTGDAIGNQVISFIRPDLDWGADQDLEKGVASRKMLLDRAATDKTKLIGFHLPFPGIGWVERQNGAYRFVAAD